jgi:hypothetical protein
LTKSVPCCEILKQYYLELVFLKEYYSDIQEFLLLRSYYSGVQKLLPLKAAAVSKKFT